MLAPPSPGAAADDKARPKPAPPSPGAVAAVDNTPTQHPTPPPPFSSPAAESSTSLRTGRANGQQSGKAELFQTVCPSPRAITGHKSTNPIDGTNAKISTNDSELASDDESEEEAKGPPLTEEEALALLEAQGWLDGDGNDNDEFDDVGAIGVAQQVPTTHCVLWDCDGGGNTVSEENLHVSSHLLDYVFLLFKGDPQSLRSMCNSIQEWLMVRGCVHSCAWLRFIDAVFCSNGVLLLDWMDCMDIDDDDSIELGDGDASVCEVFETFTARLLDVFRDSIVPIVGDRAMERQRELEAFAAARWSNGHPVAAASANQRASRRKQERSAFLRQPLNSLPACEFRASAGVPCECSEEYTAARGDVLYKRATPNAEPRSPVDQLHARG